LMNGIGNVDAASAAPIVLMACLLPRLISCMAVSCVERLVECRFAGDIAVTAAIASLIRVACLRCVWMHSRFAKIPQQTKYAHGQHDVISCNGRRATGVARARHTAGAPRQ
jgi:hypothetical protein